MEGFKNLFLSSFIENFHFAIPLWDISILQTFIKGQWHVDLIKVHFLFVAKVHKCIHRLGNHFKTYQNFHKTLYNHFFSNKGSGFASQDRAIFMFVVALFRIAHVIHYCNLYCYLNCNFCCNLHSWCCRFCCSCSYSPLRLRLILNFLLFILWNAWHTFQKEKMRKTTKFGLKMA